MWVKDGNKIYSNDISLVRTVIKLDVGFYFAHTLVSVQQSIYKRDFFTLFVF